MFKKTFLGACVASFAIANQIFESPEILDAPEI